MFENSLIDSSRAAKSTGRTRWVVAASLGVQSAVLAGFITIPLLFPAVLPVVVAAPRVLAVTLPKPRPKPRVEPVRVPETHVTDATTLTAPHVNSQPQTVATVRGGGVITRGSLPPAGPDDGPTLAAGNGMGSLFSAGLGVGNVGSSDVHVVEAQPLRPAGPLRISSGVISGLLLAPIRPVYPAIAKAAHQEGTVVLTAIIGKDGRIRGLEVVSGPEMLRGSAIKAVEQARYTPYQLNGQATEVITTVSVVFRMQG